MKKTIIMLLALLVAGAKAEWASDYLLSADAPYTERGVSITEWIEGTGFSFTNTAQTPWSLDSIALNGGSATTNTITIDIKRLYDITPQYRASEVITNILGDVLTNTYPEEVTNTFYRIVTQRVYTVTAAGDFNNAITPSFQIKGGDVVAVSQTDTNTGKNLILSGSR